MLQNRSGNVPAIFGLACCIALIAIPPTQAQVPGGKNIQIPPSPTEAVEFRSVANEGPEMKTGEALVTHPVKALEGKAARAYWPASYFFNFKASDGQTHYCSGTLIGSRTLLTAAHCIPASNTLTLVNQDTKFNLSCRKNTAFDAGGVQACFESANCPAASDVALCFLSNAPVVQRLEVVAPAENLSIGMRTLISGFGCTDQSVPQTGSTPSGTRQVLTVGWAAVGRRPSQGNSLIQLVSDSHLGANKPAGLPAANAQLCKGDSGGGTYAAGMNEALWDQRALLGVNSFYFEQASYVVSLSTKAIRDFMSTWATQHSTDICGVTNANSSLCGRSLKN